MTKIGKLNNSIKTTFTQEYLSYLTASRWSKHDKRSRTNVHNNMKSTPSKFKG